MSGRIMQLNEGIIKEELGEMVKQSVEDTLNALLEEEADRLTNAKRYGRTALKEKHHLRDLLKATELSRSSYYYQRAVLCSPGKYKALSDHIQEIFESNYSCYGYRRIHSELEKQGSSYPRR